MLTVPCKVLPPATVAGVSMTLRRAGGARGVQPDNVACGELPPPFTVTIQVGELNGCTWILKAPAPSEVPSAAPSTKIVWLGRAPLPSRRSCPAFSSARVIVGAGAGGSGVTGNKAGLGKAPEKAGEGPPTKGCESGGGTARRTRRSGPGEGGARRARRDRHARGNAGHGRVAARKRHDRRARRHGGQGHGSGRGVAAEHAGWVDRDRVEDRRGRRVHGDRREKDRAAERSGELDGGRGDVERGHREAGARGAGGDGDARRHAGGAGKVARQSHDGPAGRRGARQRNGAGRRAAAGDAARADAE